MPSFPLPYEPPSLHEQGKVASSMGVTTIYFLEMTLGDWGICWFAKVGSEDRWPASLSVCDGLFSVVNSKSFEFFHGGLIPACNSYFGNEAGRLRESVRSCFASSLHCTKAVDFLCAFICFLPSRSRRCGRHRKFNTGRFTKIVGHSDWMLVPCFKKCAKNPAKHSILVPKLLSKKFKVAWITNFFRFPKPKRFE